MINIENKFSFISIIKSESYPTTFLFKHDGCKKWLLIIVVDSTGAVRLTVTDGRSDGRGLTKHYVEVASHLKNP